MARPKARCARAGLIAIVALSVTACGPEATLAAPAPAAGGTEAVTTPAPTPQDGAPASGPLPIRTGVYADVSEGCAAATRVFFYDGAAYGEIGQARPEIPGYQSAVAAYADAYRIERVGTPRRGSRDHDEALDGFLRIWSAGSDDGDLVGIRVTGPDRFTKREGGYGATGAWHGREDRYQRCSPADLAPRMQDALRTERPQLAVLAGPADVTTDVPATPVPAAGDRSGFPPVEIGYYAIGVSCDRAIADGGDLLVYLDRRGLRSFDGDQPIDRVEPLGGDRYRLHGPDMTLRVTDARHFSSVEYGDRYTHCPTDRIPRALRSEWGDLAGG